MSFLARFVLSRLDVVRGLTEFLKPIMHLQCNVRVIADAVMATILEDYLI